MGGGLGGGIELCAGTAPLLLVPPSTPPLSALTRFRVFTSVSGMARIRLKAFWGAVDVELTDEQVYTAAEVKPLGLDVSEPGGNRVSRAQLVFSRPGGPPGPGPVITTIDFLNLTAGNPDDTWV